MSVQWSQHCIDAARKIGREPQPGPSLERWVTGAGFVNVRHHTFRIPVGNWARDERLKLIGAYMLENTLFGLEGFTLRLYCEVLGWSREEVKGFLQRVREDLGRWEGRGYFNW